MSDSPRVSAAGLCVLLSVGVFSVGLVRSARAEVWSVSSLHPSPASSSVAYSMFGGQQVGHRSFGGGSTLRATLWSGTADSWVDLHPVGYLYSWAYGTDGEKQVGFAYAGEERASLWSGTADSWVNLHPSWARSSAATAVHGGQQVGYVWTLPGWPGSDDGLRTTVYLASLWTGTAESWVALHPAGATQSYANGVYDGQQVGWATVGVTRASLWSGTPESWVDLHPAEAATRSEARAIHDGQQVGIAYVGGAPHASLWSGTSASWVDLNPAGATESYAYGVFDGRQVGRARFGARWRAGVWSGTPESWVDLSSLLDDSWNDATARAAWGDETGFYVVGFGDKDCTGAYEALLWTLSGTAGACCYEGVCRQTTTESCRPYVCDVETNSIPDCGGTCIPCGTTCFGDVNGDGVVTAADRGFVSAAIGQTGHGLICQYDMDGNGFINAADRGFISAAIGRCVDLPDFQNGSGMNHGMPDSRFGAAEFMGAGTVCADNPCAP